MRAVSASSSSSVTRAPPSPRHGRFFDGKNENVAASPSAPAFTPPSAPPTACAASSITGTPRSRSSGTGARLPNRWTGTIALVCGVIAASTVSRVTLNVSGSMSHHAGRAPSTSAASAVA